MNTPLKTVKIGKAEYLAIRALAKKRGQFIQHHLNEAIRQYIAVQNSKEQAA
jgi:hypothetical protein